MTIRHNFNAGPSVLPAPVLARVQSQLRDTHGSGASILEWSHRSPEYERIHVETESRLRRLMGIDERFAVLFLQGGASLQFAQVPWNLASPERLGAYVVTGVWAKKALEEAARLGRGRALWSGVEQKFQRLPTFAELPRSDDAAYLHLTTNNTIYGTEWSEIPRRSDTPLVLDASSNILSRPICLDAVDLLYAGAQKNLGPAGLTVVVVRRDVLSSPAGLPKFLTYAAHVEAGGLYHTPPTFAVWVMGEVLRWVEDEGGVEAADRRNQAKADLLYAALDRSDLYSAHVNAPHRSRMNVTFRLQRPELEPLFLEAAHLEGFEGLAGHRSVGGLRASLYNALPLASVEALVQFLATFERQHS